MRVVHKMASVIGFREPAAKGAMVRGTRARAMDLDKRTKSQWTRYWCLRLQTSQMSNGSFHGLRLGWAHEPVRLLERDISTSTIRGLVFATITDRRQ